MFIAELLKIKRLENKLEIKLERQQALINQSICIQELIIYAKNIDDSCGEFIPPIKTDPFFVKPNIYRDQFSTLPRLTAFIRYLARVANAHHERDYGGFDNEGIYFTKKNCRNKITRLLTHEFSFYTEQPLTLVEFEQLIEEIDKIAQQLRPNVHLLLSSFAIQLEEGVLNNTIYLQGGAQPKINSFCKTAIDNADVCYDTSPLFKITSQSKNTGSLISCEKESSFISTMSSFIVETEGGAQYLQLIEVCLEHSQKRAKSMLLLFLNSKNLIPNQVDHLLSSNCIKVVERAKISNYISQVDPYTCGKLLVKNTPTTLAMFKQAMPPSFPEMRAKTTRYEDYIKNPPFGFSFKIKINKERRLGELTTNLKTRVTAHNQLVKKQIVQSYLKRTHPSTIESPLFCSP